MTTTIPRAKRKRPFTLMILCLLLLSRALVDGLLILDLVAGLDYLDDARFVFQLGYDLKIALLAVFAVLFLISSIGIWLLRPLAWQLTMIVTGAWMMADLWIYLSGDHSTQLSMLFSVFTVYYLVQSDVRQMFGVGSKQGIK